MKEKLIKTLKIVLIIFGVLFLIQILLFILIMLGLFSFSSAKTIDLANPKTFDIDFNDVKALKSPKEMEPIINYVEDYQLKNKKYPEKLENVKVKKDLDYKYEISKDANCYTITVQEKNKTKNYQRCKSSSDNSNLTSQSYTEYSK